MTIRTIQKSTQSALLLVGILLTVLAVVAHRFLPERRLSIDSARAGANFFLVPNFQGPPIEPTWVEQAKFHYACRFPEGNFMQGCGFGYMPRATRSTCASPYATSTRGFRRSRT
jgi:hypothetical protein